MTVLDGKDLAKPKNRTGLAHNWVRSKFLQLILQRRFSQKSDSERTDLSRVCAVAQYAVLEGNGKVNGIGKISHPSPSQTLGLIWMPLQIYHYVPPGSRCAKCD